MTLITNEDGTSRLRIDNGDTARQITKDQAATITTIMMSDDPKCPSCDGRLAALGSWYPTATPGVKYKRISCHSCGAAVYRVRPASKPSLWFAYLYDDAYLDPSNI